MPYREFYYRWEWQLQSSPEQLWPLVADTNHFDRDAGLPAYEEPQREEEAGLANGRRRLRIRLYGVSLDYIEEPFEWVRPYRFGIIRYYETSRLPGVQPLAKTRALAQLFPLTDGGTRLVYEIWATPRNLFGFLAIPFQIGFLYRRSFGKTFQAYDKLASSSETFFDVPESEARFPPGGLQRLAIGRQALIDEGVDVALVDRLIHVIEQGDDLTLNKVRPFALADHWQVRRRDVLEMCLLATRHGLLGFRWDLLCPLCRVAKDSVLSLADVNRQVHCDTCNIDYKANFEQSVELTFRPSPAVRYVDERVEYCTSGPQAMPHVALQQLLPGASARTVNPQLEQGRYRLRALALPGGQILQVAPDGLEATRLAADPAGWPAAETLVGPTPELTLENHTDTEQLFVLERVAWTDQAATAAEVTTMQKFRDLFAGEALRPGDQISVGSLAILFTDLLGSTEMYRQIGDAPAFGVVMDHFDVLRKAIADEDGTLVKTIGDAVMAVFLRPVSGIRAILRAQRELEEPPPGRRALVLRAALHHGPCIAVTLNERLDYFGSAVNVASRLEKFSNGGDVIISERVYMDPEVSEFLNEESANLTVRRFSETIRGFENSSFPLWRITRT